jgi:hypothetical protein
MMQKAKELTLTSQKLDQRDMGEPFGNDSTCLRYAASAKAGANFKTHGHSRI